MPTLEQTCRIVEPFCFQSVIICFLAIYTPPEASAHQSPLWPEAYSQNVIAMEFEELKSSLLVLNKKVTSFQCCSNWHIIKPILDVMAFALKLSPGPSMDVIR